MTRNLGRGWRIRLALIALALIASGPVRADTTGAARIGEVWVQGEVAMAAYHNALVDGLRDLGYVEGKNMVLVTRYANGDESQLPSLIAELIRQKVDVLFVSQAAVGPALKATSATPIVCATMNDPVGAGQAASLARPGRNLTGLSWQSVDTATKRFEMALELKPRLAKLAVLFDPADRAARHEATVVESAARDARVQVTAFEVRSAADARAAFAAMATSRPHVLYVVDSAMTIELHEQIAAFAITQRVPMISESRVWAEAGGVLSYGANLTSAMKRGAAYIDKILKGAKPQELPIQQPVEFELIVNLKSAKAIGVNVPQSIMSRADHVIR